MKQYMLIVLFLSAVSGIASAVNPEVTIQVSGCVQGTIVLELYPDKAPVTVANFLGYVKSGFYDGLIFHRVMPGFMIQGGGYDSTLVKKATGPAIINESTNGLANLRGTVAMARTPYPHSATAEFFINHIDNSFLNYGAVVYDGNQNAYYRAGYCVFGRVISGLDVVDAIAAVPTKTVDTMANVPETAVLIQSVLVTVDVPVCAEKLEGDINGDCRVDFEDLQRLALNWLENNAVTSN